MRRLGSILLSGVLLGVPRALESRAFGMRRPVYFEVAPDTGLDDFSSELERALHESNWPLARSRASATTVVEVVGLRRGRADGRPVDTVTVVVREGRRVRRLMLVASPGRHADAARELLARLAPGDC
jgi:hypothetical protein